MRGALSGGDENRVGASLDEVELEYLFLDASMFKMHSGARAEPVLAAWGITTSGALCGCCSARLVARVNGCPCAIAPATR
jgi:hypothetical protein